MLALLSLLSPWMLCPDGDTPRSAVDVRYRELKVAAENFRETKPPWQTFRKFAPEFLRLAQDHPDDPASLSAILAAAEYGSQCLDNCRYDGESHAPLMDRTLNLIGSDRLDDDRVGRLCLVLPRLPSSEREAFLRRVARDSKSPSVRGRAWLALAELLRTKLACAEALAGQVARGDEAKSRQTWGVEYLAHLRDCDRLALRLETEGILGRVAEEYHEVAFVRGTSETTVWLATTVKDIASKKALGTVAEADLDEIRHLAPGCVAPEIVGRDAEDVEFKLSDYRGKVVLLTFSGNWCGPCRSMYPFERDLVERLRGRQFVLLSVNTDNSLATLRESIRSGEVTWRCWWDGGPGGSIASRWNVRTWPTIYLLDARGVIRAKNPRDESLGELIDGLLDERNAGHSK